VFVEVVGVLVLLLLVMLLVLWRYFPGHFAYATKCPRLRACLLRVKRKTRPWLFRNCVCCRQRFSFLANHRSKFAGIFQTTSSAKRPTSLFGTEFDTLPEVPYSTLSGLGHDARSDQANFSNFNHLNDAPSQSEDQSSANTDQLFDHDRGVSHSQHGHEAAATASSSPDSQMDTLQMLMQPHDLEALQESLHNSGTFRPWSEVLSKEKYDRPV